MVEEYYPGRPAIGLCQYPMGKFEPSLLKSVLASHRMQIADRSPGSNHCSIHFRNEKWTAEVVANQVTPQSPYYYVVHHCQPLEIAGWGCPHRRASES
jgi:hypothetical protein